MIATKNATKAQRKSCRARNDNRPMGFQESHFSNWKHQRVVKAVKDGILDKSALTVTMTIRGRGKKK